MSNIACSSQGLIEGVARLPQSELNAEWERRICANLVALKQAPRHGPPNIDNEQRTTNPDMSSVIVAKAVCLVLAFKSRQGLPQLALRP